MLQIRRRRRLMLQWKRLLVLQNWKRRQLWMRILVQWRSLRCLMWLTKRSLL
ncbi:unnamed protein product [Arabidopsis halleri]